jgi:hypothetical protein
MASPFTLQTLIDTVQGGLLLVQPDSDQIIAANQLAAILLALPHPSLQGRPFSQFLPQAEDSNALRNLLAQQGMIYNLPFQRSAPPVGPLKCSCPCVKSSWPTKPAWSSVLATVAKAIRCGS